MVRIKHRYLLFNILYPDASPKQTEKGSAANFAPLAFQTSTPDYVDAALFIRHLKSQIEILFGDYGVGAASSSLKMIYFSAATSTAILRVPRNHHQLVWAALTHITHLPLSRRGTPGKACVVRVVRVSGTIRKIEEELIRRARQDVVRAKLAGNGNTKSWLPSADVVGKAPTVSQDQIDNQVDVSMQSIVEDSDVDDSD